MTDVLLSVKPEYAEKILDGKKKYEFRRAIFKRNDIEKIYIYSSSPIRIVHSLRGQLRRINSRKRIFTYLRASASSAQSVSYRSSSGASAFVSVHPRFKFYREMRERGELAG